MSDHGPNVYAVSRSIWDDPDFADEPYTEREAWLWLIGAAAWKELRTRGTNGPVNLARGEFCFSLRFLADKWGWSKSRVERFFKKLEKQDMLESKNRDSAKVYYIRNYNKFQVVASPKQDTSGTHNRDASGTAAGQQRDKEETGETGITGEDTSSLRSDVCAEPQAAHAPAAKPPSAPDLFQKPVFISIPTNRFATIGEEVGITEAKVAEWEQTYPAVDVRQQLRQIRQWSIDKPIKRKTMKGMMPFVSNWLAREQNKGGNRTYDNGRNGSYANGHKQNAHDAFILGAAIAGGVVAGGPTCTPQPGDDANVALEFGQPRSRAA